MRRTSIVWIAALVLASPARVLAGAPLPLQSQDSAFGLGTLTLDPNTGLQWLDLTESTGYSHAQILTEIQPGGVFAGYHYATDAEIGQFLVDAGIDVGPGSNEFIAVNYAPIVGLANLIGVLGANGNCGGSCTFFYTQGYTAEPPPYVNGLAVTALSWFDNDPLQSASYPQASIGRVLFGGGTGDQASPSMGSWLIVPEPEATASGVVALVAIAAGRLRRAR